MRASLSVLPIATGVLCFALTTQAQSSDSAPTDKGAGSIYVTHVTVINTETGRESLDQTVVVSGDRISEVKASKKLKPTAGAKVVDGTGKYLIPGLWDMHVHAMYPPRLDSWMPLFVANGVVGIRDMGSPMKLADVNRLREEIAAGSRPGPRIVDAGPILDGQKQPPPFPDFFIYVTGTAQGRDLVRSIKSEGFDFVKVYSGLPRDVYFAIVDEAKAQGIAFAGHVPTSVSALEASDAGQRSMEHMFGVYLACSSRESELRAELRKGGTELPAREQRRLEVDEAMASYDDAKAANVFEHLAKNKTWQVPTLTVFSRGKLPADSPVFSDDRLRYIPPSTQQKWTEVGKQRVGTADEIESWTKSFAKRLSILGAMHRAGIPILAGTDTGWYNAYSYPGFELHEELRLLVRAGLTPLEALQSATINPARFLGMQENLGTVEKGKLADIMLLKEDPLQDIANTQKIEAVIANGRLFDRTALASLLVGAENAVKDK
jgi:imidazolonepropionase-like amidohydrolase